MIRRRRRTSTASIPTADEMTAILREANPVRESSVDPPTEQRVHQIVAAVEADQERRRGTRRRRKVGVIVATSALVSGAAIASAVKFAARPDAPETGVTCRSSGEDDGAAVVLPPGSDPIEQCRQLWVEGVLPDPDSPLPTGQTPPPLLACVRAGEAIAVVPDRGEGCEQFGRTSLDPHPARGENAVVALQQRVTEEINAPPCKPTQEVVDDAQRILDDLDLAVWSVEARPEALGRDCAKALVDSSLDTIFINPFP